MNTVSQQLAGKLELAPLLDLVGEQIRTVFKADIAYVALYNPDTGIIDFPYQYGEEIKPLKFGEGLTSRIIRSGEPLIINRETDRRGLELGARVVGRQALSYMGVPIPVGGTSLGVISVQSTEMEGAYDVDDQRLLSTHRRERRRRAAERAAVQRDAGGALAPDGDRRHPARDQRLAHRRAAGVRRHRRHRAEAARLRFHRAAALRRHHVLAGRLRRRRVACRRAGRPMVPSIPAHNFPSRVIVSQGDAAHPRLERDRHAAARTRRPGTDRRQFVADAAAAAQGRVHRRAGIVARQARGRSTTRKSRSPSRSSTRR